MNILYATDGSEGALAGARFLACLSLDQSSTIRVLCVVDRGVDADEREAALAGARDALAGTGAQVSTHTRWGNPAEEILEDIRRGGGGDDNREDALDEIAGLPVGPVPDLVVVGTHGRSAVARFFVGSVAERVARHAPCPVLLARPLRDDRMDRVLVGVDGSPCSRHATDWLRERFPLPPACRVRLQAIVTPDFVVRSELVVATVQEEVRARARQERDEAKALLETLAAAFAAGPGRPTVTTDLRQDDPASGLLNVAEAEHADLLVVGAHGYSGMERFLIGSVSEKVLRHAGCSVLVVRQAP